MGKYKHWHWHQDDSKMGWLGLDKANAEVNSINEEVLHELDTILDNLPKECAGLIIYSRKKKGFIAGADIHEIALFDEEKAGWFIQYGQTVFNKLAQLSIPTVAMIQGFCLGGGTELALACRYRIMADTEDSCMGLPEVKIGIIPGWGGMQRLSPRVGSFDALTRLAMSGKNVYARPAFKLGLIDALVPDRELKMAAIDFIQKKPPVQQLKGIKKSIECLLQIAVFRKFTANIIRAKLKKLMNQAHYPAPYAVLDFWEKNKAPGDEVQVTKDLMAPHGTARQLIRLFLLRDRLKNLVQNSTFRAKHIHIVGAGVMGADIAAWCAWKGLKVTITDPNVSALGKAMLRAVEFFKKQSRSSYQLQAARDRLILDFKGKGLAEADVIIEAIVEKLEIKQAFFKMAEKAAKPEALLASNTSSLLIKDIAKALEHPERLVGIHFFNPVTKMELVEVVKNNAKENPVDNDLFEKTLAFIVQIGKLPLPVKDSPGFLVNRVLMPYLMECMILLDEGVDPSKIDNAAINFGMMMGPVELSDTVGLDICLAVANNLAHGETSTILQQKVTQGLLGKKTGEGFFKYDKQGRKKPMSVQSESRLTEKEIANRLVLRIVQEAAVCLDENVVADKDLLDAAMVFGTGFAPFRGGPMMNSENDKQ